MREIGRLLFDMNKEGGSPCTLQRDGSALIWSAEAHHSSLDMLQVTVWHLWCLRPQISGDNESHLGRCNLPLGG